MCFCCWTFVGASSRRRPQLPARCGRDHGSERSSSNRTGALAEPACHRGTARRGAGAGGSEHTTTLGSAWAAAQLLRSKVQAAARALPGRAWGRRCSSGARAPARSGELVVAWGSHWGASPRPHVLGQGGRPRPSSGSRGAQILPCAPRFLPGCESHHPVQEPLHLKGHQALKSAAKGGRGGLTPCRHLFAGQFPACHPRRPVPRGEVLPVGGTAHGLARATSPVPAPRHGSSRTVPICGDGGKPRGLAETCRGKQRAAALVKQERPLPTEGTPQRDEGLWHHRTFFVNLFFSLILKKILSDFPGNKSLTYSCQRAEVGERALGHLQTLWHRLRHHESPRAQRAPWDPLRHRAGDPQCPGTRDVLGMTGVFLGLLGTPKHGSGGSCLPLSEAWSPPRRGTPR